MITNYFENLRYTEIKSYRYIVPSKWLKEIINITEDSTRKYSHSIFNIRNVVFLDKEKNKINNKINLNYEIILFIIIINYEIKSLILIILFNKKIQISKIFMRFFIMTTFYTWSKTTTMWSLLIIFIFTTITTRF